MRPETFCPVSKLFHTSFYHYLYSLRKRGSDGEFKALNQSLNALTHQKAIAPSTAGVCFLGTPHRGASVAALGETIYRISKLWGKSPNLRVLQALKYDAETLDRVQSSFNLTLLDARCKINIRSFREAEKHHGVTVGFDTFNTTLWPHILLRQGRR